MSALTLSILSFFRGLTPRAWLVVGALVIVLLACGYCSIRATGAERARNEAATASANAKVTKREAGARETAADERLTDTLTTTQLEKERADAVSQIPDARPSPRRVARGCVQLRQQGTRERDLPAVCRPGS